MSSNDDSDTGEGDCLLCCCSEQLGFAGTFPSLLPPSGLEVIWPVPWPTSRCKAFRHFFFLNVTKNRT